MASKNQKQQGSGSYAQECLVAHNKYRAMHGCPPLKLNNSLTKYATEWAQNLVKRGAVEHRPDNSKYGENIFFSTAEAVTGEQPVKMWYDEIEKYDYAKSDFIPGTGHFTQVVWKGTTEVGVGIAKGKGRTIVVANYNPPGNVLGQFKENVPPKR